MAYTSLGFDIFARDRASKTFKDVGDNIDRSRQRAEKFKNALKAGAVVAGAAMVKLGKDSVVAASDLNETLSKTEQIFGKKALPALEKFAAGAAKSLGQSKKDALDAASTFGIFGKAAGLTGRDLTGFSTKFTKLASDMASFNNTSPEEAVHALGAAMRGESEPIRRYGVLLNEDAKAAEAVRIGLVKNVKNHKEIKEAQLRTIVAQRAYNAAVKEDGKTSSEALRAKASLSSAERSLAKAVEGTVPKLTQQQKTLATASLVMKQTKDQQNDFARTSGGLANQQRILSAQFENVKASIGEKLLPAVVKVFTYINDKAIPAATEIAKFVGRNATAFKILAAVLGTAFVAWKVYNAAVKVGTAVKTAYLAVHKLHLLMFAKTVVLLTAYTASIVAHKVASIGLTVATKAWTVAQWALNVALRANPIGLVITAITLLVGGIILAYKKSDTFRKIVDTAFKVVRASGIALWEGLKKLWDIFKVLAGWIRDKGVAAFRLWFNVFSTVATGVIKAWRFVVDKVIGGVEKMLGAAAKIPGPVGDSFAKARDAVGKFRDHFNDSTDKVIRKIEDMKKKMASVPKKTRTDAEFEDRKARAQISSYVVATNKGLKSIRDEEVGIRLNAQAKKVIAVSREVFGSGPGFARGGGVFGQGTETSDSIPARLSKGEHIWTAREVKAAGGHAVIEAMRRMAINGELGRVGDPAARFAMGGAVGDPHGVIPHIRGRNDAQLRSIQSWFGDLAEHISARMSERANKFFTFAPSGAPLGRGGDMTPGQALRGAAWARTQAGKPYIWGGVGPGGYDCSGFVGAVLNASLGRYPYTRLGNTDSMPWAGFTPGGGLFSAGWFTGNPGHMAGNVGGLGIESAGGVGSRVGGSARSVRSFPRIAHYDSGGFLAPGVNLAINKTGAPEPVLTNRQWRKIDRLIETLQESLGRRSPFVQSAKEFRSDLKRQSVRAERLLNRLSANQGRRNEFEGSVSSPFMQNDALFAISESAGGFSLDDFLTQLRSERRNARMMRRNLNQARRSGLSGMLFRLLASSGNVVASSVFGSMSPMQIADIESLFRSRNVAARNLGSFAGREVFGQSQRELRRSINTLERTIRRLIRQFNRLENRGTRAVARKRALGGPTWPGDSFLVGENGPEVFEGRHGYIRPIRASSARQRPLEVHVFIDGKEIRQSLLRLKRKGGGVELGIA